MEMIRFSLNFVSDWDKPSRTCACYKQLQTQNMMASNESWFFANIFSISFNLAKIITSKKPTRRTRSARKQILELPKQHIKIRGCLTGVLSRSLTRLGSVGSRLRSKTKRKKTKTEAWPGRSQRANFYLFNDIHWSHRRRRIRVSGEPQENVRKRRKNNKNY